LAWKKEGTRADAYGLLILGILILLMFPFVISNYAPFIILNVIGICIALIIISAGIIMIWKTRKTTP